MISFFDNIYSFVIFLINYILKRLLRVYALWYTFLFLSSKIPLLSHYLDIFSSLSKIIDTIII